MKPHSRAQRYTALLACFAILLALFMPSVSSALAARSGDTSWSKICTTNTGKATKSDATQSGKSAPLSNEGMHGKHCAYCFTNGASFALPPAQMLTLPVTVQQLQMPALFYTSPSPLFVWASVQSRAPPRLS
ncbi:DUF2946 domain-containing protein [Undibacterium sp. SXout7W]|uniref:DUF2946 domain-containing protein n=1 Tax=Undibacterium sp. SXout7W TaxID=3413049 RepID=UPI003BF1770E